MKWNAPGYEPNKELDDRTKAWMNDPETTEFTGKYDGLIFDLIEERDYLIGEMEKMGAYKELVNKKADKAMDIINELDRALTMGVQQ